MFRAPRSTNVCHNSAPAVVLITIFYYCIELFLRILKKKNEHGFTCKKKLMVLVFSFSTL